MSRPSDRAGAPTRDPGRARPRPWRALSPLAAVALVAACGTAQEPPGVPGDTPTSLTLVVPEEPPPDPTDPVRTAKPEIVDDVRGVPDVAGHAPRTVDDADAAQDLTLTLQADPRFGNVAVAEDGGYVVYWHGEPAPELTDVIARHPDAEIRLEPTAYLPGQVRDLLPRIMAEVDGASFAGPEVDYSGVTVGVVPEAGHDPEALGRELSERYGLPVTVEVGSVAPAQTTVPER
jgi:hypothetical protein